MSRFFKAQLFIKVDEVDNWAKSIWSLFEIQFQLWTTTKGQALAEFLALFTEGPIFPKDVEDPGSMLRGYGS